MQAGFGPGVREVDEEHEAEEDEERRTDEGYPVAPKDEEAVRDEEGDEDQDKPQEDLRAPPPKGVISEEITREFCTRRTHFVWQPVCPVCVELR